MLATTTMLLAWWMRKARSISAPCVSYRCFGFSSSTSSGFIISHRGRRVGRNFSTMDERTTITVDTAGRAPVVVVVDVRNVARPATRQQRLAYYSPGCWLAQHKTLNQGSRRLHKPRAWPLWKGMIAQTDRLRSLCGVFYP